MRGHRIAGPDRADFTGGLVAHGEHEIRRRRARLGEFVPAFTTQPAGIEMRLCEQIERERVHRTLWKTAGAMASKPALAPMIDQCLGKDASGRIAGA